MPRWLPNELLEEVLCRLPPHEPAGLVRAALVSKRWCRLVSDPGFRRRFREFHHSPPMLGMLLNLFDDCDDQIDRAEFIPTTAFCFPRTEFSYMRVLDARHGRVLCHKDSVLAVWDPITDEVRELPFPRKKCNAWTAAVLCSAAAGACDHLDCHRGPFLVVFLGIKRYGGVFVYTYSSNAAAWSEPDCAQQKCFPESSMGSALVGNALYFGNLIEKTALKYNFELRQISMIQLPSFLPMVSLTSSLLTTTEDGGLVLVTEYDSKLYLWSGKDTQEVDSKWERRVIELKTVFPVDVGVTGFNVIGSGVGIIFMSTADEVYTIDLKTYKVKKVYEGTARTIVPYMSFYTPALEAACSGEEPSAGGSCA